MKGGKKGNIEGERLVQGGERTRRKGREGKGKGRGLEREREREREACSFSLIVLPGSSHFQSLFVENSSFPD